MNYDQLDREELCSINVREIFRGQLPFVDGDLRIEEFCDGLIARYKTKSYLSKIDNGYRGPCEKPYYLIFRMVPCHSDLEFAASRHGASQMPTLRQIAHMVRATHSAYIQSIS